MTRAIGAVDIGGTKIAAGCVDGEGRLLARRVDATEPARGWECAVDRIAAMLGDACRECGAALDGIGIGCTGMVDPAAGTVVKPDLLPGWHGAPVATRLGEILGLPAAIENDADAAALAEAAWGFGRGAECFVFVTVGTGIGGGIVHGGRLYRGSRGAHPELGHLLVDPGAGPACYCGLSG